MSNVEYMLIVNPMAKKRIVYAKKDGRTIQMIYL